MIHLPRGRRLFAVAATLTALIGAAVATNTIASAQTTGKSTTSAVPAALSQSGSTASKPTVVFVHGGWADSSGWNAEIAPLQGKGYPVIAVANPLRGLTSDADYVRSVLQTIPGPVVLVGHSYGGAVITNAAVGAPNVKALVYIAAFAPDTGESLQQLVTMNPGTQITPDALDTRPYPLPGGGTGIDLYIKAAVFHDAFAGDLPRKTTDLMQATQRPFSVAAFTEPSGTPAWKTIPSWYLVPAADKTIPPEVERSMARRAGSHTVEIPSSHAAMVSNPGPVADLIRTAATAQS